MIFLCILSGGPLFARGRGQKNPPRQQGGYTVALSPEALPETAGLTPQTEESPGSVKVEAEEGPENPESPQLTLPPQEEPDRGERVMKALAQAYPDRLGPAEYRDGDWAVPVRGEWYYYAEGRLLPEELRSKAAEYDPQSFYRYSAELPPWREPDEEEAARLRERAARRAVRPLMRSQHFYDALWRAHNRDESYDRIKTLRFLGRSVMVHYAILEELSLVEETILGEAKNDPQVRQWINRIGTLDAWNWRTIANTQSRSFHAYGAAVDILPSSTGKLETYWLWTARAKSDWWTVSYEQRLHPPAAVIKAFEAYGFVWGGKWLFYDTMHFEYRPEIFILNDIPLTGLR
ncbi:MAG: M15 family metallopeptidase [Treponema sp.]|nr:M15 family metallopeptidase [Treponema sp.]